MAESPLDAHRMSEFVHATLQLYRDTLVATGRSLRRGWLIVPAVGLFSVLMLLAGSMAGGVGMIGGLLLGLVNALLIGATLSLIEESLKSSRTLSIKDIGTSFGQYFGDVIGIGFMLWVPVWALESGMATHPQGHVITAAIFLLGFILLNPVPEVIYQVRHHSPLDVIRESYEFVMENWLEWFLPLAVILGPLGLTFFFQVSSRMGRGAGLNFFDLLLLPGTVVSFWLGKIGIPEGMSWLMTVIVTPPLTVLVLMFRGNLFAALHGSTRRQRAFKARVSMKE